MIFIPTASLVSFGMKSGVQPCVGCGLKFGCGAAGEPSGFCLSAIAAGALTVAILIALALMNN